MKKTIKLKRKNRKAQLGATLTLIVATIVISFILAIFYYLSSTIADFKFKQNAEISVKNISKEQSLISLKAFLQTPINIILDEEKISLSIADLIKLNEISPGGDIILREQAEKIFQPFGNCYFFRKNNVELGNSMYRTETAIVVLPVNAGKSIEVGLAVNNKCISNMVLK